MKTKLALVIALALALTACDVSPSWAPDPQAQRIASQAALERAEAARVQAEGAAAAERERARGEAAAEKMLARAEAEELLAASRQMEREASHQRWMETLTTLAVVMGALLAGGALAYLIVNRPMVQAQPDYGVALELARLREQVYRLESSGSAWAQLPQQSRVRVLEE